MGTTKTYSFNLNGILMTDFDAAVAFSFGYQAFITNPSDPNNPLPNPETKPAFSRRMMLQLVQERYAAGLVTPAVDTARATALSSINIITIL